VVIPKPGKISAELTYDVSKVISIIILLLVTQNITKNVC
jgi:hypothetical protein